MKLVGERRALASAIMVFYGLIFFVTAMQVPPQFARAFYAIAGVYGLAFFALVAQYFWARWYAVGVSLFGLILGVVGLFQAGELEPTFMFFAGTHLAAVIMLWGSSMAQPYDGQTTWREKFHMDDNAVQRLGRSVIRAGLSLPFILLYALMPRQGSATMIVALLAAGMAAAGLRGVIRLRAWGIVALGGAAVIMGVLTGYEVAADAIVGAPLIAGLATGTLALAVAPFGRLIARAR